MRHILWSPWQLQPRPFSWGPGGFWSALVIEHKAPFWAAQDYSEFWAPARSDKRAPNFITSSEKKSQCSFTETFNTDRQKDCAPFDWEHLVLQTGKLNSQLFNKRNQQQQKKKKIQIQLFCFLLFHQILHTVHFPLRSKWVLPYCLHIQWQSTSVALHSWKIKKESQLETGRLIQQDSCWSMGSEQNTFANRSWQV